MDESWRIPIGSVVPRRRSTEQQRRPGGCGLDPDDFRDVFGGPPRTVLLRQFSGGDLTTPSPSSFSSPSTASYFDRLHRNPHPGPSRSRPSFYEEVFRRPPPPEAAGSRQGKLGRSLPGFMIPPAARRGEDEVGLYGDVFGWEFERRSRTRSRQSKSNSSSVLSSEDQDAGDQVGPLRPWLSDDGVITSFASKLRPITVPARRCDAPSPTSPDEEIGSHRSSTVACPRPSLMDLRFQDGVCGPKAADPCRLYRPYSPPEAVVVGVEPKGPTDPDSDGESSPSSVISFIDDIPMATIRPVRRSHGEIAPQPVLEKELLVMLEEGEEESESSYVIEMVVPGRKGEGSAAVDEAIAWAKEKSRDSALQGVGVGEDQKKPETQTHAEP